MSKWPIKVDRRGSIPQRFYWFPMHPLYLLTHHHGRWLNIVRMVSLFGRNLGMRCGDDPRLKGNRRWVMESIAVDREDLGFETLDKKPNHALVSQSYLLQR